MSIEGSVAQYKDGRIRGSFVYVLLCRDGDGPVYAKIGLTDNLDKRIPGLLTACPVPPKQLFSMHVWSRKSARSIERALHFALESWWVQGEWFRVQMADKARFNAEMRTALTKFRRPGWPLTWDSMNVERYQVSLQVKRVMYWRTYRKSSKAKRDAMKDIRQDLR